MGWLVTSLMLAASATLGFDAPPKVTARPSPVDPPAESRADDPLAMRRYTQKLTDKVSFEMIPVPGGEFQQGSPQFEPGSRPDERPVRTVMIDPFWMGRCEVTWDEFDLWAEDQSLTPWIYGKRATADVIGPDAVTRPSRAYTDHTFGMGREGFPAVCMSQLGAKMYCRWLSLKTGQYYRLPSEAEWEYACRAGTQTAWSFGNDPARSGEHAWSEHNSADVYHQVGRLKPNAFGLHDMHGNVAEWVLDRYDARFYAKPLSNDAVFSPLNVPGADEFPRVVRGGSYVDPLDRLRSAARTPSTPEWNAQDPNVPQSPWYTTETMWVGFRILRPLRTPTGEEIDYLRLAPDMPKAAVQE
jgi:formylglycine-generating enzyme required for sulfatase activity